LRDKGKYYYWENKENTLKFAQYLGFCALKVGFLFSVFLKFRTNMLPLQNQKRIFKMKFSELYRLLEENGWTIKKGAKHIKYIHPDFDKPIPVGRHPSKEVPKGTLEAILREARLK